MSLLFFDGFDHYTTLEDKGWAVGNDVDPTIVAEGRLQSCLKWDLAQYGTASTLSYTPLRGSSTASGGIGFGFKVNGRSNIGYNGNKVFFSPLQSGESGIYVTLNADGTFSLYLCGFLGTPSLLATSSGGIADNTWAFVEFKWLIDNSGSFVVRIDGTTVMNYSGGTLSGYTPSADWQSIRFFGQINAFNATTGSFAVSDATDLWIDDLYLIDLAGSINNDLLNDCTVECLLPQTDAVDAGTNAGWTCSTGSDHGALVDESDPDDDTTYVYASTNVKDTWNYPSMSVANATIYGVQVSTSALKADTGTAEFKNLARVTTTDNQGTTTHSPTDTAYVYYRDIWETNPDDSTVWTVADVNGSEFGVERTA